MENNQINQKQKKGLLAMLWESMTKTGGCCGGGGNCCGTSEPPTSVKKPEGTVARPIRRV